MRFQIFGIQCDQVVQGAFSFINAMRTVGVWHELELLVVLDQLIEQQFGILVVDIIIPGSVNVEQVA